MCSFDMSWPEHSLNVTFIVVYLVVLAWHGWYGQRRTRSLSDFLIGGRQLGGVLIGLALGVGVKFVVEPR